MAEIINSASLVKYNANIRGNDVGDCVCRSISLAFDISYSTAGKALNAAMKKSGHDKWNIRPVFNLVIKQYGGSNPADISIINKATGEITGSYPTVEEFADGQPDGCFIVLCGKDATSKKTTHMVCIIDGKVYDSWDSRKWYVKTYYSCSLDRHVADTYIEDSMDLLAHIATDYAEPEFDKLKKKWIDPLSTETTSVDMHIRLAQRDYNGFTITTVYKCTYYLTDTDYMKQNQDEHNIRFKISYVLKPGMNEDEAKAYIQKIAKQRVYDRMYAIRENIKNDLEAFEVSHMEGAETADQSYMFTSPAEERFIKQLPGKVRPFISYIYIQSPGQYSNSYDLKINRMPGDPNPDKTIRIEAYDAESAKDMVLRYVKKFERPYVDYSPGEDY